MNYFIKKIITTQKDDFYLKKLLKSSQLKKIGFFKDYNTKMI